jgi:hypothetical protein
LATTIPVTIAAGVYVPMRACRLFRVSFGEYLVHGWARPLLVSLPFTIMLALAKWYLPHVTVVTLVLALAPAGLVLAVTYWQFVVPASTRRALGRALHLPVRLSEIGSGRRATK